MNMCKIFLTSSRPQSLLLLLLLRVYMCMHCIIFAPLFPHSFVLFLPSTQYCCCCRCAYKQFSFASLSITLIILCAALILKSSSSSQNNKNQQQLQYYGNFTWRINVEKNLKPIVMMKSI